MMTVSNKAAGEPSRINLRLSADMLATVDAIRIRRAGNVSRNTWIAEAIQEKILREEAANNQPKLELKDHA
jgi:metal-responsive CopG/Arc/MetJ family transcriptional regulator